MAAAAVSTVASVMSCRVSRARLAPSAARIASSWRRSVVRESSRCARLAHAISSTNAIIPMSTSDAGRTGPASRSRSGNRCGISVAFDFRWPPGVGPRDVGLIHGGGCARLTPGLSLPMI